MTSDEIGRRGMIAGTLAAIGAASVSEGGREVADAQWWEWVNLEDLGSQGLSD